MPLKTSSEARRCPLLGLGVVAGAGMLALPPASMSPWPSLSFGSDAKPPLAGKSTLFAVAIDQHYKLSRRRLQEVFVVGEQRLDPMPLFIPCPPGSAAIELDHQRLRECPAVAKPLLSPSANPSRTRSSPAHLSISGGSTLSNDPSATGSSVDRRPCWATLAKCSEGYK